MPIYHTKRYELSNAISKNRSKETQTRNIVLDINDPSNFHGPERFATFSSSSKIKIKLQKEIQCNSNDGSGRISEASQLSKFDFYKNKVKEDGSKTPTT